MSEFKGATAAEKCPKIHKQYLPSTFYDISLTTFNALVY